MSHRANLLARDRDTRLDSRRLKLRRALTLMALSLVAPGSAQVAMGRRWVGWLALTVWLGVLGSLGYLIWRGRTDRAGAIDLITDPDTLLWVRVVLIAVAVGWVALFLDAWRIGGSQGLGWPRALLVAGINIAIIGGLAGSAAYAAQFLQASRETVKTVFVATETSEPLQGRYNILLVGSDSGPERTGIRPDSLTVASIDTSTGRTVLISMPRNLQNVPFPDDSPMHALYPNGYNCGSECLLNAVHTAAQDRTDLFPDSDDPGLDATIDAVEGITDLKINYFLMVNLKGFRSLIDAVGGVDVDVKTRIAMFGHDDAYKQTYIEPGQQKLDGQRALWYARSRVQSDDYTRMGRQKCLMSAMLQQFNPTSVVTNAVGIAKSGKELLGGNMPQSELGRFADLALRSRGEKIVTVSLVPPVVDVTTPDFGAIHDLIDDALKRSEDGSATASPSDDPTANTPGGADDRTTQRSANNADDLSSAC